jgi:hypothetical protein
MHIYDCENDMKQMTVLNKSCIEHYSVSFSWSFKQQAQVTLFVDMLFMKSDEVEMES